MTEITVAAPPPPGKGRRDRGLLWFAAPSLLWYLLFTVGPLFAMFYIAFLDWKGIASTPKWAGWNNITKMLHDPRVGNAAVNTVIHLGATLPLMMVISFMLGYFLNLKLPGHRVLRVIMFIPALISVSSLGMLFIAVLGPVGLINAIFNTFGSTGSAWLANAATAMPALIFITIWSGTGFNGVLFSARLSAIDADIFAAADLDGAGHWQKMWNVALPIAMDYFGVLTMLQFLWTLFGSAGLILILTQGGPGDATETLSWLVFRFGYSDSRVGYSQALGILLFVAGIAGLLIIRRVLRARY
ncbi:MAG: sugar ABC transporter permease [Devosia sp.]